jgi:hypothetical protein
VTNPSCPSSSRRFLTLDEDVRNGSASPERAYSVGHFSHSHGENMAAKKKAKRTTLRSSTGTKLYAKRKADGTFSDIQTYKRAHGADIKRKATGETAKKKK